MTNHETDIQLRRKKLLWRATHRGTKEMDLMLGTFASGNLSHMSSEELDEFETIIEISDAYLGDWITGKNPIPEQFKTNMFRKIKDQTFFSTDYKKL